MKLLLLLLLKHLGSINYKMVLLPNLKVKIKILKVYIYNLHKKTIIKNITSKSGLNIKIELTEIEVKNRTNLRDKFTKTLKRKQDYR